MTFYDLFYFNTKLVCIGVWIYVYQGVYPQYTGEGVESLGTGVSSTCEHPKLGAWN